MITVLNKLSFDAITAGTRVDRSQTGNKSCFRNETYNTIKFTWDPLWTLPKDGKLEFDFCYFDNRPESAAQESPNFDKVVTWFKDKANPSAAKNNPTESSDHEGKAEAPD